MGNHSRFLNTQKPQQTGRRESRHSLALWLCGVKIITVDPTVVVKSRNPYTVFVTQSAAAAGFSVGTSAVGVASTTTGSGVPPGLQTGASWAVAKATARWRWLQRVDFGSLVETVCEGQCVSGGWMACCGVVMVVLSEGFTCYKAQRISLCLRL